MRSRKQPDSIVRVQEFLIGRAGEEQLKVGIAEDGTLLIIVPPNRSNEEHIISLGRGNALQILRHLVAQLEKIEQEPTQTVQSEASEKRMRSVLERAAATRPMDPDD